MKDYYILLLGTSGFHFWKEAMWLYLLKKSEQIKWYIEIYTPIFIQILYQFYISNLNPGATYDCRRISLQRYFYWFKILMNSERLNRRKNMCRADISLYYLLLDMYEPNKKMAYQIINSFNTELLNLDSYIILN